MLKTASSVRKAGGFLPQWKPLLRKMELTRAADAEQTTEPRHLLPSAICLNQPPRFPMG
jgi:hypothetical protein